MTIVEHICAIEELGSDYDKFRRDTITLGWEERRQGHGRRRSDNGIEFAISLQGGVVLRNGHCFVLEPEKAVVTVREALEPVYVVRPKTPRDWAHYAYHVGNRHQAVMIAETELVFPQTPAVRSLLDQLRVDYVAEMRPFTATSTAASHSH
jgi:urease accessory protein